MTKPKTKEQLNESKAAMIERGTKNLLAHAQRRREQHAAAVAQALEQLGIAEELDAVRALPMEDKKAMLLQLTFAGLSLKDASKVLGVGLTTASRWFQQNPEEMQRLVRATLSSESLKEVGPTWARLQQLRFSANAETSRKAALDCLAVAGMNPHGPSGITVNVNAQNAQLALMPVNDLEAQLKELAKAVGPNAEKIVDAELVAVRDFHGNAARKAAGPAHAGGDAQPDQGDPGRAPAPPVQPAD